MMCIICYNKCTIRFSELTTVRVGGEIHELIVCADINSLVNVVANLKENNQKFQLIAGGSNILPQDDPIKMPVVFLRPSLDFLQSSDHYKNSHGFIWAGENLDDIVKIYNLAPLSGIPGSIGGAVVQNAGAYGAQISDYVESVQVLDTKTGDIFETQASECSFQYRNSRFKHGLEEIVLSVKLRHAKDIQTVGYDQLANALGVELGEFVTASKIRYEVLKLRASKGMLAPDFLTGDTKIDASNIGIDDVDRRSVGSFFMNPIVSTNVFENILSTIPNVDYIPHWEESERIKLSAAWLIGQAGFSKGFQMPNHRSARVSSKHTLALVNSSVRQNQEVLEPGRELRELAKCIQEGVFQKFGVQLEPEPIIL